MVDRINLLFWIVYISMSFIGDSYVRNFVPENAYNIDFYLFT